MSKHTRGPWRVCDGTIYGVESEDGDWICDCIETEANARLIAATPRLLEALSNLHDLADVSINPKYSERSFKAFCEAEKLLKELNGVEQ